MAPRLSPAGGSVLQVGAATTPIFILLVWFLWEAHQHSVTPPCTPYWADNEHGHKVLVVCKELIQVQQTVLVYLVVALSWGILAVYLTFYVPQRHALLQQYLSDGIHKLGDVHYESQAACGGLRTDHWGQVTYPHVNYKVYPAYVSRRVPVLQRYTRERVTIVVLPDCPFSGLPKADVELDVAASTRHKKRLFHLVVLSWVWLVFSVAAPVYILACMESLKLGFGSLHYSLNWILYAGCVGVLIPVVSLWSNHAVWTRYYYDTTQRGHIAEGPAASSSASTQSTDMEVGRHGRPYKPPVHPVAAAAAPLTPARPPSPDSTCSFTTMALV